MYEIEAVDELARPPVLARMVQFIFSWLLRIANIFLLNAPTMIIRTLSTNFQITLSLSSILMGCGVLTGLCFLVVRYKYLTGYSKGTKAATATPADKKASLGLVLKKKRDLSRSSNYLDEFLSAIKVFGYLEKPVFHELTKNMTTQRVSADEIIHVDEKLGFSIVVEGTIQVFIRVKSGEATVDEDVDGCDDGYDDGSYKGDSIRIGSQRYHLLNEVKSGAPLSSLMSALDHFKRPPPVLASSLASPRMSPRFTVSEQPSPTSESFSPLDHNDGRFYPEIVARPKVEQEDTKGFSSATIAIIPKSAFERVQSKYPRASSHIVTMVLTRLYKVTMNTIHNYLGLTSEIIESEIKLNNFSEVEDTNLPSYLRDGIIEKFMRPHERSNSPPGQRQELSSTNKSSSASLASNKFVSVVSAARTRPSGMRQSSSRYVVLDSRTKSTHPGDLLSSVPLSRRSDYYQTHTTIPHEEYSTKRDASASAAHSSASSKPRKSSAALRDVAFSSDREETEETSLRIGIVENLFKLLGINELELAQLLDSSKFSSFSNAGSGPSSKSSSILDLTASMEPHARHNVLFQNPARPKGSLSHRSHSYRYETVERADFFPVESRMRTTLEEPRPKKEPKSQVDLDQVKFEFSRCLELKYYPANTLLVEQGKFDSGMYYVIDGSLDVVDTVVADGELKSKRHERKLYTVKAGGLAGYLSSIVGFRSLVSIKAPKTRGVIVAHISKKNFSMLTDKFYFLQLPVATKLKTLLSKKILTIDYALEWCHIPAGNVLCAQGDMANGFHIVLSGRFRVVRSNTKLKRDRQRDGSDENDALIDDHNQALHTHKKYGSVGGGGGGGDTVDDPNSEDMEVLGEYGHGESIGEVEVLTASRRTNSLVAVRDSETARIPRTLFEMLSMQNPSIMIKVSRIVANKMAKSANSMGQSPQWGSEPLVSTESSNISTDYKTITILPTTAGLPVRDFADKLVHALRSIGRKVIALDQASTLTHLGRHAFDERLAQLKLSGYFAYLEEEYETIVYVCDSTLRSNWTSTCISQGDCILLLADAEDNEIASSVGEYEKLLLKQKSTARTDLCLIHPERYVEAGSTSVWLKSRIWVQGHHHIQMEIPRDVVENGGQSSISDSRTSRIIHELAIKISNKTNPKLKRKFEDVKAKALTSIANNLILSRRRMRRAREGTLSSSVATHKDDFLRLARILSHEAVGLVLGGGGSRGISHIGVVAALEKHGIPVDLIGGTSIGSFVGGLYAKDYNSVSIYGRAKVFSTRVSSLWRSILDLTYPVTSYITGYEFNRGIWKTFGFSEIEDFWLRYFCNSTNITNSTMDIHEKGYSWRFIRASMSLAGLLPPIAYDGCMLLDGGYLDNLPVMEMKRKGAKYIIAVDVGSVDDRTPMNYGDTLSGFWVLFNRWNPFSTHPNVPNMMDIQLRLAYVASVKALEIAKKTPGVIYLRPPIDNYATLDFAKFDEIYHVGMNYADELFGKWEAQGRLPQIAGRVDRSHKDADPQRLLQRRNSL
ncbi:Lysophospholipase NTE1 [[Candida] zeylanoides]